MKYVSSPWFKVASQKLLGNKNIKQNYRFIYQIFLGWSGAIFSLWIIVELLLINGFDILERM